jgi:hypothetical protein
MENIGHSLGESGVGDGLSDVIGDFEPLTLLQVGRVVGRGHDNYRKMAKVVAEADAAEKFESAQRRKFEIKEEGDEFLGGGLIRVGEEIESLASIGDEFDVGVDAAFSELAQEEFAVVIIVFDDENADRVGVGAHGRRVDSEGKMPRGGGT